VSQQRQQEPDPQDSNEKYQSREMYAERSPQQERMAEKAQRQRERDLRHYASTSTTGPEGSDVRRMSFPFV